MINEEFWRSQGATDEDLAKMRELVNICNEVLDGAPAFEKEFAEVYHRLGFHVPECLMPKDFYAGVSDETIQELSATLASIEKTNRASLNG